MVCIAAAGDLHFGDDSAGTLRPHLDALAGRADVFLIAGDATRVGDPSEAAVLARELDGIGFPVVAVLGNHDYHSNQEKAVAEVLEDAGVRVLEGEFTVIEARDTTVGIAGVKGFGGGFEGASGSAFGEPVMKAFMAHTEESSDQLGAALEELAGAGVDHRIALVHYAPIPDTLAGERLEIYPFLGSYLLGEAIDRAGADVVVHGHAHGGAPTGLTPGGIPVRNVAQPVVGRPVDVFDLPA